MVRRTLSFAPEAEREAHEAFRWYRERDERAGARFEGELLAAIDRITETSEQGPEIEQGVRRMLLHRFPYGVLYAIASEHVLVLAVMHLRRRPGSWRGRGG
ncbi:type II toxin-antitoxin system RelE/ParE family toxin [Sorangium sp. So ce204]|uniref:type II toxin-antitoxin system RelE/ParE family toxin n=1 Tax=Sorangium sp. So ce204 TaxID=3133288 RepID=UPI003F5EC1FD